jgi:hypothetical protein
VRSRLVAPTLQGRGWGGGSSTSDSLGETLPHPNPSPEGEGFKCRRVHQIFQPEWIATSPPSSGSTLVWVKPASRIMRSNSGMGGKRRIDSIK